MNSIFIRTLNPRFFNSILGLAPRNPNVSITDFIRPLHNGAGSVQRSVPLQKSKNWAGYLLGGGLVMGLTGYWLLDGFNLTNFTLYADAVSKSRAYADFYIWGSNSNKLIPGSEEEQAITPKRIPFFDGKVFLSVSIGPAHAAALDSQGNVYQWGSSYFGSSERGVAALPEVSCQNKELIQVACGQKHTFALSKNGKVYILGSKEANSQQIATKEQKSFFGKSVEVQIPTIGLPKEHEKERIVSIASGDHHLIGISANGKVFAATQDSQGNAKGQLGLGSSSNIPTFQWHLVSGLDQEVATQVSCGESHTLILTKSGKIFGFGSNESLQLGTGQYKLDEAIIYQPIEIKMPTKKGQPKKIAAGGGTSLVIVEANDFSEIYSFGRGLYGQLGVGQVIHASGTPTKIETLSNQKYYNEQKKVVSPIRVLTASLGSNHASAVLDTGYSLQGDISAFDVYLWGFNKDGQLGNGGRAVALVPSVAAALDQKQDLTSVMQLCHEQGKFEQNIVCGNDNTALYTTKRETK